MLGEWVVDRVHEDRVFVVVDGNVYHPPRCQFNAGRCAAAPGKAVHNPLFGEADLCRVSFGFHPWASYSMGSAALDSSRLIRSNRTTQTQGLAAHPSSASRSLRIVPSQSLENSLRGW